MSFLNRFLPETPKDDLLQSVLRNLDHLLNAKRGYGSLLCHFGVADYLGESSGNAVQTLLREIQDTVVTYETRLRIQSVKVLGRNAQLRLFIELQGTLLSTYWGVPCRLMIRFHIPTGAISVEAINGP